MLRILIDTMQLRTRAYLWVTALMAATGSALGNAAGVGVHHDLQVRLVPNDSSLEVVDRVRLPQGLAQPIRFSLGAAFDPRIEGGRLVLDGEARGGFRRYLLEVDTLPAEITLRYRGRVANGGVRASHGMPVAVLDQEGAFFDGASGWYPAFGAALATFRLQIEAPLGWQTVSQGKRSQSATGPVWQARSPQDDIYLIAGPFSRYAQTHRGIDLEVYLLGPDQALAERYLAVMGQYLDFYGALIDAYPYPKFAVVENRWQTGYGMPSFTLLGSRVLRLPFILHTSLPHEILHNWWGNGVYVAWDRGNWSEGLTAYLSDHLIKETQGDGAAYRRRALERYASFAAEGRDFALRQFQARHSDASQAVGYSKALMIFHMLRRELGDATFVAGLKAFWETFRFQEAGFADLKAVMERTAGRRLLALDDRWLDRPGAPSLALETAESRQLADGRYALSLTLTQRQAGPLYPLTVPIAVRLAGAQGALWREVSLGERTTRLAWVFDRPPERVDVDPDFDVFRLLDERERPATLARLFGARRQLLVLPADAPEAELGAWHALAQRWSERYDNVEVVLDRQLDRLPEGRAVWLLGWENRWLGHATHRFDTPAHTLSSEGFRLRGDAYGRDEYAVVILDADNSRSPLGFIGAGDPDAIAGLARKLPHYGRYGRLVFAGAQVENRVREELPVPRSPLTRVFGDADPGAATSPGRPLAALVGVPLRFD